MSAKQTHQHPVFQRQETPQVALPLRGRQKVSAKLCAKRYFAGLPKQWGLICGTAEDGCCMSEANSTSIFKSSGRRQVTAAK